ncbi:MAG: hypothetical protein ONB13_00165 [candidate division KSB1 bacterium]|nr:hypothetical protein [candidate division KSB1 bacterium]MDZ7356852.1 hypothetical protein [candidate division KSB1 bacterium]MDZ7375011.1 hypothetical protein [candidate division KSB1 bacterium]MDZ7401309.1 hypothetical protein [candidate division KSB1 bacterium]
MTYKLIKSPILILLLFCLSKLNFAQPSEDIWTRFGTSDGLASDFVNAMLEASDGTLWFGTAYGISSFHQGKWTKFRAGLINDNIHAICEARDGAIWFGSDAGAISFYFGQWTNFAPNNGLPNYPIRAIFSSHDGALWFGTDGGGVSRYFQGQWSRFTTSNGLASNRVFAITETSDGTMWFGTYGAGVSQFRNGQWTTLTADMGLADNQISAILQASDGALWFGTSSGVSRYENGSWTTFTTANGLVSDNVTAIAEASDRSLWIGTSNGVSRYRNGSWKNYTMSDGLVANHITAIVESADEAIWFSAIGSLGISGGVSRLQPALCQCFTSENGLICNSITALLQTSDGSIWVGTTAGISRFSQDKWTKITKANGLVNNKVRSIIEAYDQAVWICTDSGVSRLAKGVWQNFTKESGLSSNQVNAALATSRGELWFATAKGASYYYQGKWQWFTTSDGLSSDFVTAIVEDQNGAIWFGTANGLTRYRDGIMTKVSVPGSWADNDIRTLLVASDGALWVGTYEKGVKRLQEGVWTSFREQLASESIHALYESSDGAIWVGTSSGASRFYRGEWANFSVTCGLQSDFITAIVESFSGDLWFGTKEAGLSRLRPDRKPPKAFFIVAPQQDELIGISNPLFMFSGIDRSNELGRVKFAWYLFDSTRAMISGDSSDFQQQTIVTPTISTNGRYSFSVLPRDAWGNVAEKPLTRNFEVDITPPTITIISPRSQDVIAGDVAIIGSAYDNSPGRDLESFQLRYAVIQQSPQWFDDRFSYKQEQSREIRNDTLAIWHTEGLANGNYWLHLLGRDKLEHVSQEFVPVEIVSACKAIHAPHGGRLGSAAALITLYVPPNALERDRQIYVKDTTLASSDLIQSPQIQFIAGCYKLAPTDLVLSKPITLSINFRNLSINDSLINALGIYRFIPATKSWHRLGGTISRDEKKITTASTTLGIFALYCDLTRGVRVSIANVNCQPRIFSPQGGGYDSQTAISFDLGEQAPVTIKIYNAAGRLVRYLTENQWMAYGSNVVYWDGKDQWGEFCVSGLYIVTVQARGKLESKTVVISNKY